MRIPRIKNAKFSGYCFYINTSIYGDSQICIRVPLKLSSNLIGSSNLEPNFPHKLLLTDMEVSKIRKTLANYSLANIKFSKTQLPEVIH